MDPTGLLDAVEGALGASPALASVRVLRVVVHERSEADYRALRVAERTVEGAPPEWGWAAGPSLTAWRALVALPEPVVVDAQFGSVSDLDGAARPEGTSLPSAATMEALLDRGTTHLVASPLLRRGRLAGMACAELRWSARGLPPTELWHAVARALAAGEGEPPSRPRSVGAARETGDPLLPVAGPVTEPLYDVLARFAASAETILLLGDTGVGKTMVARWCHERSARAGRPFVTANLHAIPATLFEGELFGWRRGAHDLATTDRPGLVAEAEGGTLFLDEIDKLDPAGQGKLLQLLDERTYRPLGARGPRRADVRFIVATNADLGAAVASGAFRNDLYYRITVLPVRLPSLAERREEVPVWARSFATALGVGLDPRAAAALAAHPWAGNLRELDRVVRRAAALAPRDGEGAPAVDAEAVARALAALPGESPAGLAEALDVLVGLVADALAHGSPGFGLADLDLLRGLVLEAAAARMPVADVYRALGEHRLVDSRNHQAAYKRDVAAAHAARARLVTPRR